MEQQTLAEAGYASPERLAHSWVMYSPTDLLKLYLRDSFNRENIAASSAHLKTWDDERISLARNVFGVLRTATRKRGFQLRFGLQLLQSETSARLFSFWRTFDEYHEDLTLARTRRLVEELLGSAAPDLRRKIERATGIRGTTTTNQSTVRVLAAILEYGPELQPDLKELKENVDLATRQLGNRLLREHEGLYGELLSLLDTLGDTSPANVDDDLDTDLEEDGDVAQVDAPMFEPPDLAIALPRALQAKARADVLGTSSIGGLNGKVLQILGERLPDNGEMMELGKQAVLLSRLRSLLEAPKRLVVGVPTSYRRFRRSASLHGDYFLNQTKEGMAGSLVSEHEVDVMLLTMLRNARRLLEAGGWRQLDSPRQGWLEAVVEQYRAQVYVDEATDLSSVQLACTMELTHPRVRSWFVCGDLLQRVTGHGIATLEELDEVAKWCAPAGRTHVERRRQG